MHPVAIIVGVLRGKCICQNGRDTIRRHRCSASYLDTTTSLIASSVGRAANTGYRMPHLRRGNQYGPSYIAEASNRREGRMSPFICQCRHVLPSKEQFRRVATDCRRERIGGILAK